MSPPRRAFEHVSGEGRTVGGSVARIEARAPTRAMSGWRSDRRGSSIAPPSGQKALARRGRRRPHERAARLGGRRAQRQPRPRRFLLHEPGRRRLDADRAGPARGPRARGRRRPSPTVGERRPGPAPGSLASADGGRGRLGPVRTLPGAAASVRRAAPSGAPRPGPARHAGRLDDGGGPDARGRAPASRRLAGPSPPRDAGRGAHPGRSRSPPPTWWRAADRSSPSASGRSSAASSRAGRARRRRGFSSAPRSAGRPRRSAPSRPWSSGRSARAATPRPGIPPRPSRPRPAERAETDRPSAAGSRGRWSRRLATAARRATLPAEHSRRGA